MSFLRIQRNTALWVKGLEWMFLKTLFLIFPDNLDVVSITQTILYVPLQSHKYSIVVCLKRLLRKIQVTRAQRLSVVMNTHQVSSKKLSVRSSATLEMCFGHQLQNALEVTKATKLLQSPVQNFLQVQNLYLLHSPIHLLTHSLVASLTALLMCLWSR